MSIILKVQDVGFRVQDSGCMVEEINDPALLVGFALDDNFRLRFRARVRAKVKIWLDGFGEVRI